MKELLGEMRGKVFYGGKEVVEKALWFHSSGSNPLTHVH